MNNKCFLGCTETPLLIKQSDVAIEIFDTTEIHLRAAENLLELKSIFSLRLFCTFKALSILYIVMGRICLSMLPITLYMENNRSPRICGKNNAR